MPIRARDPAARAAARARGILRRRRRFRRRPRPTKRMRRMQGLTTTVQWFKRVQTIASNTAGLLSATESSVNVASVDDFKTYGSLYSQYKVLKMICRFYPANVGGESMQVFTAPGPQNGLPQFQRGNTLTYCGKSPLVATIESLIVRPSARLFNPRRFHKRWIDRPKSGYPEWGELNTVGVPTVTDEWDDESEIHLIGDNFTPVQAPGQQNYFYLVTLWKVIFRSRQE